MKKLKNRYRSDNDNLLKDFFIPSLKTSKTFNRATGYFSSNSLKHATEGLYDFIIKNKGKINLITSPFLTPKDFEEIKDSQRSQEIAEKRIMEDLNKINAPEDLERLNLLAWLLENRIMDIKIAIPDSKTALNNSIYHEKIGYFIHIDDSITSFTGSANESLNGYSINFESIFVFYDNMNENNNTAKDIMNDFDYMWSNKTTNLKVIELSDAIKDKIIKFKRNDISFDTGEKILSTEFPKYEKTISLRDYQKEAIKEWKENNYHGIFEMATGTGKTITAVGAILNLLNSEFNGIIIILSPLIKIAKQWFDELKNFNIDSVLCSYENDLWKTQLQAQYSNYLANKNKFICITSVYNTFFDKNYDFFINLSSNFNTKNSLLVIDEVHNIGTDNFINKLPKNMKYRLGLSATLERFEDPDGTETIINYFNKIVYSFSLSKAIKNGYLTPYYYYPIFVTLTEDEKIKYKTIINNVFKKYQKNNKLSSDDLYKAETIASKKTESLINLLSLEKQNKSLIYSPPGKDEEGNKIIHNITMNLGEKGLKSHRYTSEEDPVVREKILNQFKKGIIDFLVAVRCLDEGVDIPEVSNAYFLNSSRNPKQFIQRRGRILRKKKGKENAKIFDLIIEHPFEETSIPQKLLKKIIKILTNDIDRMDYFAKDALNANEAHIILEDLKNKYSSFLRG